MRILIALILIASFCVIATAQEAPYFVTYDHHLEEPGNLEVALSTTAGPGGADHRAYFAPYLELEYGVKAWWTSEFYLEGQSTLGDSTVPTGWRVENRFRVLRREHRVNPVLYFEYENLNEASKIQKEIVGNTSDFAERNAELRATSAHELETKLILSSDIHNWNLTGNFIVEKNLSENEGFEFGYALGLARPLSSMASANDCRFCRENFTAGLELYGGLGSTNGFGLRDTSHYLGPVVSWQLTDNVSLHFSPAAGLTRGSSPILLRFGYSYELRGMGGRLARVFGGKR